MRKLLVALFALGLVVAFSAPLYAATVDFTGHYRWQGKWQYNTDVTKPESTNQAWMDQRLRIDWRINVAEGLSIGGRLHAMDRIWGLNLGGASSPADSFLWGDDANLRMRRTFATIMTEYGRFQIGYQAAGTWGTAFADAETNRNRIHWMAPFGDLTVVALYEKRLEQDAFAANFTDQDMDSVAFAGIYRLPFGQVGLLYQHIRDNTELLMPGGDPGDHRAHVISPYFKLTFGDLYLEGQYYWKGGGFDFDDPTIPDIDYKGHSWYLYAKYAIDQWYVGGQYAFVQGDDGSDPTKNKAGQTGSDYNPTLLLWNDNLFGLGSQAGYTTGAAMANAWLIQGFVGGSPMPNLDVKAALTYARAHKTDVLDLFASKKIGTEFDIEATWKIFDNLSWWFGFGYLWTGDFYKGNDPTFQIDDTWMVMHKLQLNF